MRHPGRKLYHVLGGLALLAVWFALGRPLAFYAYGALLAAVLLFDAARFSVARFNAWAMANLGGFLRPGEERGIGVEGARAAEGEPDAEQAEAAEHVVEFAAGVLDHRALAASGAVAGRDDVFER